MEFIVKRYADARMSSCGLDESNVLIMPDARKCSKLK
jgi:hypothetical protein